jgi:hypothetical protein
VVWHRQFNRGINQGKCQFELSGNHVFQDM